MDSFYGGKPGFSFIIVINYASIDEMVSYFQQGPDYTAVHYDEHVLINTENKNDPDNGKIFRRGYDYSNDLGGAIYVGTIVGPAGKAPMLELTTVEEVKAKQATEGYEYRYSEGSYAPFDNLIPGKDGDTYNDEIQWACCSIRDENESDCIAYIGFIVPYMVVDYTAQTVSAYFNRNSSTSNFVNTDLANRIDDSSHPYYEKWHFNIPKGIKGDAFKNFRVMVSDSTIEAYDGQDDDIANQREVLVYDYYNYDADESGEPVTIYLGDYNMITNITIDDNGTITVEYAHDDDLVYTNLFKWIKEITLDTNNGHFTIVYNYDQDTDGNPTIYETDLAWVSDITLDDDGKVTIHYVTGTENTLEVGLRWINKITLDEDGTITVNYNDGTSIAFEKKIQWITNVSLSDDGEFRISFNNGTEDYVTNLVWVKDAVFDADGTVTIEYNNGENTIYQNLVQWITSVTLSDDGEFKVKFNNSIDDYVTNLLWVNDVVINGDGSIYIKYNNGEVTTYTEFIKVISNVTIETADSSGEEGTGDQKVHVSYNTGETDIIGEPLNYIMRMEMVNSNYHLLVLYSDPAKRQAIIEAGQSYTYDGIDGWFDLGAVKDESGILIGLNISLEDYPSLNDIGTAIGYLNNSYPNGLTGTDLQGKVITIGDDEQSKKFYAFDYNYENGTYKGWYYLGSFELDVSNIFMIASEDDEDLVDKQEALSVGGLWFVLED